ncbi:hypothetical protein PHLGIDRAFT_77693 [Phlebiopsis gigantea 11061_1 CR5-6]|uniref:DUF6593 domain-containing protein n=1 Tax=Phlebiopsis gigantea (strain 11061_1 CR5-6) TaxID=745531 RepID=A0A0C3PDK2_PHLG1|nr:hypothetical protein PHLGIDRAFT_77693 [Phlebiopsis gigantea 11061_1 CR5-6]
MFLLQLSRNSPINTTLLTEDGKPMYTISTPHKIFRRTTTVTRHTYDAEGQPTDITEEMAKIHWHRLTSSKLVLNGELKNIDKVMPKTGVMGSRAFTASDGKKYKWRMGMTDCELADGPKPARPVVVKMRHRFQDISTGTRPVLEIEESVLPFLDIIIMTWIYTERTRRDIEYERLGSV